MDADLRAELMGAVDAEWSETIRHLPLVSGVADQTREVSEFTAVLRTGERHAEGLGFGRGKGARVAVSMAGGVLRVDRSAWPDLDLRDGDKCVALSRDGEPLFEFLSIDRRSHLRLICDLGDC